jgi:hypothetical protein
MVSGRGSDQSNSDEVTERALEQCNKRFEGDCDQLCECMYLVGLASCGSPTNPKCVMQDAKPLAEKCSSECPSAGTFSKKERDLLGD